jgi:hypothetical protein
LQAKVVFRSRLTKIVAFCIVTGIAVPFVYFGVWSNTPTAIEYGFVRFYAWSWVVSFAMFGGMEVAPAWAPIPAAIIAVFGQNVLIYFVIKRLVHWIRSLFSESPGGTN